MSADRPPVDVGRKLREAREKRGISLRQIASATKIPVGVLEALERNDISRLPRGIFGRGFVRSFAAEIGLDPDELVQDFIVQFPQASVTGGRTAAGQVEDNEAVENERRMASTFLKLLALSVPIAGVVLYLSAGGRLRFPAGGAPAAPSTPAPSQQSTRTAASDAAAPARGAPEAGVGPSSESRAAEQSTAAPPVAPGAVTQGAAAPLAIGIATSRPCWISATVDGQKVVARLFQPGDRETFAVTRELVLTAGDAAAVAMTVNGIEARPLGGDSQVVTARVGADNYASYLKPR